MNRDARRLPCAAAIRVTLEVQSTRWGPIVDHDDAGRPLALAWTAHDPRATNLRMLDFETATNVEEALHGRESRGRSGAELGRCRRGRSHRLVADGSGSGAGELRLDVAASWREPRQADGQDGARRRNIRASSIRRPADLWTANARTIDAETWLAFLGDGGYDLGARAAQIRDDLLALQSANADGHAGDSARRSRAVPHALARPVARAAERRARLRITRCAREAAR